MVFLSLYEGFSQRYYFLISILRSKIKLLCIIDIIRTREKRSSTSLLLESPCLSITAEHHSTLLFVGIGISVRKKESAFFTSILLEPVNKCLTVTSIVKQLIRIRMFRHVFIFILLNVLLKNLGYMALLFLQSI